MPDEQQTAETVTPRRDNFYWYGGMGSWKGKRRPWQTDGFRRRASRDEVDALPEPIALLAYEEYANRFGTSQSFERLHERGGFSVDEVIGLLADLIRRERGEMRRG